MLAFRPEEYAVHTEVFDGPLELLLYLIRRDGIDVRDIPIAHVTHEYLTYIDLMVELDLDLAGDFIVMAATLCQLKSRELLPRDPQVEEEEEEEDPRQALARRLLEYQRYKEASEKLAESQLLGREVFARPEVPVDPSAREIDPGVDAFGLLEAFYKAITVAAQEAPTHSVELEEYSMAERVRWVLVRLEEVEGMSLRQLFYEIHGKAQRILTFLAVLEMARLQMLGVTQDAHLAELMLVGRVAADDADLSILPDDYEAAGG